VPGKKTKKQLVGEGASQAQIDAYFAIGKTGRPEWSEEKALGLMKSMLEWFLEDESNISIERCLDHLSGRRTLRGLRVKYASVNEKYGDLLDIQKDRLIDRSQEETTTHFRDDDNNIYQTKRTISGAALFQLKFNHDQRLYLLPEHVEEARQKQRLQDRQESEENSKAMREEFSRW
jgi:hypothetical protein